MTRSSADSQLTVTDNLPDIPPEKKIAMPKMKVGAPAKFDTPEAMQDKIDEYFLYCDQAKKIYTVEMLCYFLGFEHRHALADYETRSPEFGATVRRARLKISAHRMEGGLDHSQHNKIVIFDLVNNYDGYRDTRDAVATVEVNVFAGPNTGGDLAKVLGPAPVPQLPEKTGNE